MKTNFSKLIPVDLESIYDIGVDNWLESFEWPISWKNFIKIEDAVKNIFNSNIANNKEFSDVILINYKLHIEFSNYFLALLLKKKLGEKILFCKRNKYFKLIYEKGVPDPIIKFPPLKKKKSLLKRNLLKIKNYLGDNKFIFPKFWKKSGGFKEDDAVWGEQKVRFFIVGRAL